MRPTPEYRHQRVRDPVHNVIEFGANQFENVVWDVVRTPEFQRLRRVKQLGFSDLVYPGATHSRLAHSIGVFHVGRRLMRIVQDHLGSAAFEDSRARAALAAALVHDVGHGPFSHAFEDVGERLGLKMASHETVSDALIRNGGIADVLRRLGSGFPDDVADIVKRSGAEDIYGAVVSSQFDADRLDYMQRDRLMTGTRHAKIDFEWLIANLEVGDVPYGVDEEAVGTIKTFVLGPKAVHAAEAYVLGLFQLYPTVYFHKTTRGAEKLFTELLLRVISFARDGSLQKTGLPKNHPLAVFANEPESVESVLRLDDTVVSGALSLFESSDDEVISELGRRLRDRQLFKAYDVREKLRESYSLIEQAKPEKERMTALEFDEACDKSCGNVAQAINDWTREQSNDFPRVLSDEDERAPYKQFSESKGPLNQIRIRTRGGTLVDLGTQSDVVRAIPTFKFFRLYTRKDDAEATSFVSDTVRKEIENVGKS